MFSLQVFLDSLTPAVLLTGLAVFAARIIDVSCGAIRTISLVQGRMALAFWAGFVEVVVWLIVLSNTLDRVMSTPALGVFYAFGFATGNVVGIWIERRIALGTAAIRVFCSSGGREAATALRAAGQRVTLFEGEGRDGPVIELYVVCERRATGDLLRRIREHAPDAFYTLEAVMRVNKLPPNLTVERKGR